MTNIKERSTFFFVGSAILNLVIAMGFGRFAYTPLLPIMQNDFQFSEDIAGFIASLNYVGYLLGALICIFLSNSKNRVQYFRFFLLASIITTAGMGFTSSLELWYIIRLIAGFASAGMFVIGTAIVVDRLTTLNKLNLSGLVYSGVGLGIALSALFSLFFEKFLKSSELWIGLGFISLMLGITCWLWIYDTKIETKEKYSLKIEIPTKNKWLLYSLILAYFFEGFGYVVSGTFLVSIIKESSGSLSTANYVWFIVGISALTSTIIWMKISDKIGLVHTIILAHIVQSIGIILPVVMDTILFAYIGAILYGGTFMGIVALSMTLGKKIVPEHTVWVISILTASFGTGQIIGPIMAGLIAVETKSFYLSLVISSIVVAMGALILYLGEIICLTLTSKSQEKELLKNKKLN